MPQAERAVPPRVRIVPRLLQPAIFFRRPTLMLDWCRRRYGPAFRVWLPPWGFVAIFTEPAHVKELFQNDARSGGLDGGRAYKAVFDILMGPHSMFSVEGERHLRLRKLFMKALKAQPMPSHREPIERLAIEEIDSWPVGEKFEFEMAMQRLTLAVILRDILGVTDPRHEEALRRLVPEIVNSGLLIQLEFAFPPLRRFGFARRHHRITREIKAVLGATYDERVGSPGLDKRTDVFSLLIQEPDDDGNLLTREEAIDFAQTLIMAGHETTASQMCWVMELLLRDQRRLQRARAEVLEGGDEYLEACIMEAMRLCPALPFVERGVTEAVEVGPYRLPAGTTIGVGIAGVHHAPELWEDALSFKPERFLGDTTPDAFTWIPWGGGRRRCAGKHFAMLEMKVAISAILRRVELEPWAAKPEAVAGKIVTIVPAKGGEMLVRRRYPEVDVPEVPQAEEAVS